MKISVVINTVNRAEFIGNTLEALKYQTFKNFEVIVVNGPSTDNTKEIVLKYPVKYYETVYNLSISRNVGISNASGDIIAFIDDDAIPEPEWLEQILEAYSSDKTGAAGGKVYNDKGDTFQYCYGAIDKWGYVLQKYDCSYEYNTPHGHYYNVNIGTNATFRRTSLIEVGGFDEEIEYYHDESDVCVRLINANYEVIQLDKAFVHHKFARSSRRKANKRVVDWDAIVKNTIYFGIKNSKGVSPLYKRLIKPLLGEISKFKSLFILLKEKDYNIFQYIYKNFTLIRSIIRGYYRGFLKPRKLIQNYTFNPKSFKKYITLNNPRKMNIVLVTQGFPPVNTDGISRYNYTLAKELAIRGHSVYVVTKSTDNSKSIDFIDNIWIYKHNYKDFVDNTSEFGRINEILGNTKSVYRIVESISCKVKIDLILAPLWDVEGISLLTNKIAPVVLTLMSPLKKVVETQWYWLRDPSFDLVYELEKYCINNADGIMSISKGILDTINKDYLIDWEVIEKHSPVKVIPLGVDQGFLKTIEKAKLSTADPLEVNILFVGRFEKRKGIDLLFQIIPEILEKNPNVKFTLVGNDEVLHEDKINFKREFVKKYQSKKWFKRISFLGYVTDEELNNIYDACDIFVAPSRYESFGLIFIEAMAHKKPLVGTNIGGIPEIIADGENGYLFELENISDLKYKLQKLISSKTLRVKMGEASFKLLKNSFNSKVMCDNFEEFMKLVINK